MHSNNINISPFDSEALIYDQNFTYSKIGKAQREIVWTHLSNLIKYAKIKSVLEVNCGTGEDALFLNKKEISVLPTDVSEKMVELANEKLKKNGFNCNAKTLDIRSIDSKISENKFDLIFSNFGGLNCIREQELKLFFKDSSHQFKDKKNYFLVFMGKHCLMEKLYFLSKLKFSKINRRSANEITHAKLKYESIETLFYSIQQIKKCLPNDLKIVSSYPIGFFIPPSYLESFFAPRETIFNILKKMEILINKFSFLCNYSDHFIIHISTND